MLLKNKLNRCEYLIGKVECGQKAELCIMEDLDLKYLCREHQEVSRICEGCHFQFPTLSDEGYCEECAMQGPKGSLANEKSII